jgi:alanine dehydrogenase
VRFAPYREVFEQDVVVVIRCPDEEAIRWMRRGSMLVSMLHFPTRPWRVRMLDGLGIGGLSLESVTDDAGRRLVENLRAVGWNGVEAAFKELATTHRDFAHPSRRPLRVTCLGSGAVGGYATHAATRYGDPRLREQLVAKNVPGVEVTVVDFDLTWHEDYMLDRLEGTDLLIDATHRIDPSVPVVRNVWLAELPPDAVLLDLASDPYLPDADPPMVKGIEGIPQGNLDRWVFPPDDPAWDGQDPGIDAKVRRTALSCYAWPGIHPRACMEVYGSQVEPLMTLILTTPVELWDGEDGPYEVRAAVKGALSTWRSIVDD